MTTTLASAEDGLLAAITSAVPAGVPVGLGDPGTLLGTEAVWVSEDASVEQVSDLSSQFMPAGGREERFDLRVVVFTSLPGDDYETLRDRGMTLCAAVETAVINDRTLGGAVEDAEVTRIERRSGVTNTGRALEMMVFVASRSWLA
jgi:hypothetical protein